MRKAHPGSVVFVTRILFVVSIQVFASSIIKTSPVIFPTDDAIPNNSLLLNKDN